MKSIDYTSMLRSTLSAVAVITVLGTAMTAMVATGNTATAGNMVTAGAQAKPGDTGINLQNLHEIRKLDIYAAELMTKSEIAKFRQDIKKVKNQEQLDRFLGLHRQRMDKRAKQRGVELN